jgi:hypothetical protein
MPGQTASLGDAAERTLITIGRADRRMKFGARMRSSTLRLPRARLDRRTIVLARICLEAAVRTQADALALLSDPDPQRSPAKSASATLSIEAVALDG